MSLGAYFPPPLWPSLGTKRFGSTFPEVGAGSSSPQEQEFQPEESTRLPGGGTLKSAGGSTLSRSQTSPDLGGTLKSSVQFAAQTMLPTQQILNAQNKTSMLRYYNTRMAKSRDLNSGTKNRINRAAFSSKVPNNLSHEEVPIRLGAVNYLGKMKMEAGPHADLVIARLEDDDPRVRKRAIWALKEMTAGQLEPHKHLIAARLEHRNPEVRSAAAEMMGFMGKLSLDIHGNNAASLEKCLGDESVIVRRSVIEAFFKWGEVARPHARALAVALGDEDALVRKLACGTLGQLGRCALAHEGQLEGLLADPDAMVRVVALAALKQIRVK